MGTAGAPRRHQRPGSHSNRDIQNERQAGAGFQTEEFLARPAPEAETSWWRGGIGVGLHACMFRRYASCDSLSRQSEQGRSRR